MPFEQDNFLGRSTSSDLSAEIDALKDRSLFRDGSKSMTGNLGLGGNSVVAAKDVQLNPQVTGSTPASGINLYTKADNLLYKKNSGGVEEEIGGGGVSGVAPSLVGNIPQFDNLLSDTISDSGVKSSEIIKNPSGVGVSGNLCEFDSSATEITDSGVTTATLMASSSVPSVANHLALYDSTSGKLLKEANSYSLDDSISGKEIFRKGGSIAFIPHMGFQNCFYGDTSGAGTSGSVTNQANTAVGSLSFATNSAGQKNTCVGTNSMVQGLGNDNTCVGASSGVSLTGVVGVSGQKNTFLGSTSGANIATGSQNLILGHGAGSQLTLADSNNIILGDNIGVVGDNDTIRIGNSQTETYLAGVEGVVVKNAYPSPVVIDSAGQVGVQEQVTCIGGSYNQCSPDVVIANTTSTFSMRNITGSVGTYQFGANTLRKADSYHMRISGTIEVDSKGDSIDFEIGLDPVPGVVIPIVEMTIELDETKGTGVPYGWELEIDFTFRSIGATGECETFAQMCYSKDDDHKAYAGFTATSSSTIDTTLPQAITAKASWSAASPNNVLTIKQFSTMKTF